MYVRRTTSVVLSTLAMAVMVSSVQAQATEENRIAADGGIHVPGWMGILSAADMEKGEVVENSRLSVDAGVLKVTTGPAITYWSPENTASGNYTVKATFHEPQYMNLNSHPHPYGIVIAGNDMGTDMPSYLYCAAYGNGNFIVRGFSPEAFQVNGRRGEAHAAVDVAEGEGSPVTQEIAVAVTSTQVTCSINGAVVGSYDKSAVVGDGMLKSTDGMYGIRFAHNTEATVTGLSISH